MYVYFKKPAQYKTYPFLSLTENVLMLTTMSYFQQLVFWSYFFNLLENIKIAWKINGLCPGWCEWKHGLLNSDIWIVQAIQKSAGAPQFTKEQKQGSAQSSARVHTWDVALRLSLHLHSLNILNFQALGYKLLVQDLIFSLIRNTWILHKK